MPSPNAQIYQKPMLSIAEQAQSATATADKSTFIYSADKYGVNNRSFFGSIVDSTGAYLPIILFIAIVGMIYYFLKHGK